MEAKTFRFKAKKEWIFSPLICTNEKEAKSEAQ
jgi:hypothetical protein